MRSEEPPIPEGYRLGSKVALFPLLPDFVLNNTYLSSRLRYVVSETAPYRWVERGQEIGRFVLSRPAPPRSLLESFFAKDVPCVIRSPVSGLVLHRVDGSALLRRGDQARGAFLVPDNEPACEPLHTAIHQLAVYVHDYAGRLFRDDPELLENPKRIEEGFATRCTTADAFPYYGDYLDEARIKEPRLRPFLRHLVAS